MKNKIIKSEKMKYFEMGNERKILNKLNHQ